MQVVVNGVKVVAKGVVTKDKEVMAKCITVITRDIQVVAKGMAVISKDIQVVAKDI